MSRILEILFDGEFFFGEEKSALFGVVFLEKLPEDKPERPVKKEYKIVIHLLTEMFFPNYAPNKNDI